MSENPFSPPVRDHFDAGITALTQGRTEGAVTHLTAVARQGTHRDQLMLADFLIAFREINDVEAALLEAQSRASEDEE